MNIVWDSENYKNDFNFVPDYGESVTELLTVEKGGKVMDLGCGTGALIPTLVNKGYEVTGVDASDNMLEIARKNNSDVEFIKKGRLKTGFCNQFVRSFFKCSFHWIDEQNGF